MGAIVTINHGSQDEAVTARAMHSVMEANKARLKGQHPKHANVKGVR